MFVAVDTLKYQTVGYFVGSTCDSTFSGCGKGVVVTTNSFNSLPRVPQNRRQVLSSY